MTSPFDDLERELSTWTPRPVSSRTRQSVARALSWRRYRLGLGAICALAAGIVLAMILWPQAPSNGHSDRALVQKPPRAPESVRQERQENRGPLRAYDVSRIAANGVHELDWRGTAAPSPRAPAHTASLTPHRWMDLLHP